MDQTTSAPAERWAAIADYPGYEVSDQGRVRRSAPAKTRPAGAILSTKGLRSGYPSVDLCRDGVKRTFLVHRLVAAAFVASVPGADEVNHINGVKADARASNLEYTTRAENERHAFASGLASAKGAKNGQAKLTEDSVLEIRRVADETGAPSSVVNRLARTHGVSASAIRQIVSRRRREHV